MSAELRRKKKLLLELKKKREIDTLIHGDFEMYHEMMDYIEINKKQNFWKREGANVIINRLNMIDAEDDIFEQDEIDRLEREIAEMDKLGGSKISDNIDKIRDDLINVDHTINTTARINEKMGLAMGAAEANYENLLKPGKKIASINGELVELPHNFYNEATIKAIMVRLKSPSPRTWNNIVASQQVGTFWTKNPKINYLKVDADTILFRPGVKREVLDRFKPIIKTIHLSPDKPRAGRRRVNATPKSSAKKARPNTNIKNKKPPQLRITDGS